MSVTTRNRTNVAKTGVRMSKQAGAMGTRIGKQAMESRAGREATRTAVRIREQAATSRTGRRATRTAARATAQLTPVVLGAGLAARRGMRSARAWAAPRVDHAGHALQDDLAPRLAAMMIATARRIEPPGARRLRWPMFVAGGALVSAGGAVAYLISRRSRQETATGQGETGATAAQAQADGSAPAEPAQEARTP